MKRTDRAALTTFASLFAVLGLVCLGGCSTFFGGSHLSADAQVLYAEQARLGTEAFEGEAELASKASDPAAKQVALARISSNLARYAKINAALAAAIAAPVVFDEAAALRVAALIQAWRTGQPIVVPTPAPAPIPPVQ